MKNYLLKQHSNPYQQCIMPSDMSTIRMGDILQRMLPSNDQKLFNSRDRKITSQSKLPNQKKRRKVMIEIEHRGNDALRLSGKFKDKNKH
ncbi:hypothetical protein CEXT_376281 [Caerostris extrusa]|uniref:Uncharacterized protein n=1 Tax=Caerostris extrusa TaxID=172846 RepID=A0AAV4NI56_CAEEX|nr:hypothetical protein CEXT_376281 [Caerostris extrusa]